MPKTLTLKISNGQIQAIYSDDLASLLALGQSKIERASHVEPTADGQWTADMSPVAPGVTLGPFSLRSQALSAEVKFIEERILHVTK